MWKVTIYFYTENCFPQHEYDSATFTRISVYVTGIVFFSFYDAVIILEYTASILGWLMSDEFQRIWNELSWCERRIIPTYAWEDSLKQRKTSSRIGGGPTGIASEHFQSEIYNVATTTVCWVVNSVIFEFLFPLIVIKMCERLLTFQIPGLLWLNFDVLFMDAWADYWCKTFETFHQVLTNYTRLYEGNYTPINPALRCCNCLVVHGTRVSAQL